LLIYDADCGMCSRLVLRVLKWETRRSLRFAALDSDAARRALAKREDLRKLDSVFWVELDAGGQPERCLARSDAILAIVSYLGGRWRWAQWIRIVPRRLRDWIYDLVARHRHRLGPGGDPCFLPPPEQRDRFLDIPERPQDAAHKTES
jgi:predicted DCC family thiol-disulfide oxidoreductase YuxK